MQLPCPRRPHSAVGTEAEGGILEPWRDVGRVGQVEERKGRTRGREQGTQENRGLPQIDLVDR